MYRQAIGRLLNEVAETEQFFRAGIVAINITEADPFTGDRTGHEDEIIGLRFFYFACLLYSIWQAVDLFVQVKLTGEYEHAPIVTEHTDAAEEGNRNQIVRVCTVVGGV
jgi:hypothetical protein